MVLSARISAGHCLLIYFIGNCSKATGHRSEKIDDTFCSDWCRHCLLIYFIGNCSKATGHRSEKIDDTFCSDWCRPLPAYLFGD